MIGHCSILHMQPSFPDLPRPIPAALIRFIKYSVNCIYSVLHNSACELRIVHIMYFRFSRVMQLSSIRSCHPDLATGNMVLEEFYLLLSVECWIQKAGGIHVNVLTKSSKIWMAISDWWQLYRNEYCTYVLNFLVISRIMVTQPLFQPYKSPYISNISGTSPDLPTRHTKL